MIDTNVSIELCEAFNTCKQTFPGQYIPKNELELYPDPFNVGKYITKAEFISKPKWPSSWVHWENRCEFILQGQYDKITPVHFEGIFTLLCNMLCPHCARKYDRKSVDAWCSPENDYNNITKYRNINNTMSVENIKYVINQLKELMVDNQMGLVWGGGDPTMNYDLYECVSYAMSKNISSSIITNGCFLDVDRILEAEPTLIRISLNCISPKLYYNFHGIDASWGYYVKVWDVITKLNKYKANKSINTLFGLSIIVDDRNLNDFSKTIKKIVNLVKKDGKGIDYIIIRPVMKYHHLKKVDAPVDESIVKKSNEYINYENDALVALREVGIPLLPIKDSFDNNLPPDYYNDKRDCLAYGMCGEIRYNGDVQLCSDSYGNRDYTIGNIFDSKLNDIMNSEKRKEILTRINNSKCFKNICPHNSRGHHLNRMFYQIENLRKSGQIELARTWIKDLRTVTFPVGHSFFI